MTIDSKLRIVMNESSGLYFSDKDKKLAGEIGKYLKQADPPLFSALAGKDKELKPGRNYPPLSGRPGADGRDADVCNRLSDRLCEMVASRSERSSAPPGAAMELAKGIFNASRFPDGAAANAKLSRDQVESVLYSSYAPRPDVSAVAETFLSSRMLQDHPANRARDATDLSPVERLQRISSHNLAEIRDEISVYRAKFASDDRLRQYNPLIARAIASTQARYEDGLASHASNTRINGAILPTSDRQDIQCFAQSLTGDARRAAKVTHTSETNTQHLATHDFAFFNVYPRTNDQLKAELLSATRYLREKPEVSDSPVSASAQSFTFKLKDLTREPLTVVALRDPVYPAGGPTAAEARHRLEGRDGLATYHGSDPAAGSAKRMFGTETDHYRTPHRLFTGSDAQQALTAHVQLGLYKSFYGLHQAGAQERHADPTQSREYRLFRLVADVSAERRESETAQECAVRQDKAALSLTKLFQYPQLMVAGPVATQQAERFVPTQAADDRQRPQGAPAAEPIRQDLATGSAPMIR
ncbi:hypothetical protein K4L06_06180 [Lysobacter sp. BMK333-48F3]|uniref:hypothetical protein n=1 Tax=Lysobacter sp. BMK333-48F3 TaxID=2867962 RepID=UPI001C8B7D1E|nr:hypothetical protein [Lysobacter sp. BMK333-48F3]MBX9400894.1 hypothetical protein [Lysobacter sp. BMK333-48F3]